MKFFNISLPVPGIIDNISDLNNGSIPVVKLKAKKKCRFFDIHPIYVVHNSLLMEINSRGFNGFNIGEVKVIKGGLVTNEYSRLKITGIHLIDSFFIGNNNNLIVRQDVVEFLESLGEKCDLTEYVPGNSPKDELKLRMEKMRQLMKIKYPNNNPINGNSAQQGDAPETGSSE